MTALLRFYSLLFAWMLLLAPLCLPAAAGKQGIVRTPLPTDSSVAAYVGIKARWESFPGSRRYAKRQEMPADTAVYPLTETPTRASFYSHLFTRMPLDPSPNWYFFNPVDDRYFLTVNISDTLCRLGSIVVTSLSNGAEIGVLYASRDGATLKGQVRVPWFVSHHVLEGYSRQDTPLFRLVASNGQPRNHVLFTIKGQFAPNRPPVVTTARFTDRSHATGTEGDIFDTTNITVSTQGKELFSMMCGANEQINDTPVARPFQPSRPLLDYNKKFLVYGGLSIDGFVSDVNGQSPSYIPPDNIEGTDNSRGVKNLTMPPYSDCIGHWHAKLIGEHTAFFSVPFRVTREDAVFDSLKATFERLAVEMQTTKGQLSAEIMKRFIAWLDTDEGRRSGLNMQMVSPYGDIKTVTVEEEQSSIIEARPLPCAVKFEITALVPGTLPPHGFTGSGFVERMLIPFTSDLPPPCPKRVDFTFVDGKATATLYKGWSWKLADWVSSPAGYVLAYPNVVVSAPANEPISLVALLTVCLTLRVAVDRPCEIVVKKPNGEEYARGKTTLVGGKHLCEFQMVPPGNYGIEAAAKSPKKKVTEYINLEPKSEHLVEIALP